MFPGAAAVTTVGPPGAAVAVAVIPPVPVLGLPSPSPVHRTTVLVFFVRPGSRSHSVAFSIWIILRHCMPSVAASATETKFWSVSTKVLLATLRDRALLSRILVSSVQQPHSRLTGSKLVMVLSLLAKSQLVLKSWILAWFPLNSELDVGGLKVPPPSRFGAMPAF